MKNNKELIISTGRSRKETNWKPEKLFWAEFLERLKSPARGTETLQEYKALTKAQQDELKDVGGFLGGRLSDGRRSNSSIVSRCLITLDLDNIPAGQTDDILRRVDGLGCAAVVYSTRKHESAAPRLRVVIPTDRDVTPDEYEPVSRKLAALIGIEFCDPTTFEPTRFMYWPSVSAGAEYVYQVYDKPFCAADGVMGMYQDWRNTIGWPQVPGESARINKSLKRQEDPTVKNGIIGAFCRVYDVPAAMAAFIPEAYTETATPGRYTYAGGTTTGGAVLYDDGKFLYSHHATDPCSGKLVNSFDLVRLHKFGELDDEAKPGTAHSKLPSFIEMCRLADRDSSVKLEAARARFPGKVQEGCEVWLAQLEMNGGELARTTKNIMLVLENDPELSGKMRYDLFTDRISIDGGLPWDKESSMRGLTDADMAGLRVYLETNYGLTGREKIQDAFDTFIRQNAVHEVKDYLNGLAWDGVPRLDSVLIDYLGAEDTPYTRKVARKLFCAGVARIYNPGIKYDYLVVLIGTQGTGKSTFARRMGVNWFSDSLTITDMRDKTAAEKLLGVWVNEIPEMDGFSKVDASTIKAFISKGVDRYRPAYGRFTVNRPRQSIMIGTSNRKDFLTDETGNRRFWPVDIGVIKPVKSVFTELEPVMGQIWAEAVLRWRMGESIYPDAEMERYAEEQQEGHRQEDPRTGMLEEFLKKPIPVDWYSKDLQTRRRIITEAYTYQGETMERCKVCAAEVWVECFGYPLSTLTQKETRQINAMLLKLCKDWKRENVRFGTDYGRQRGFVKVFQGQKESVPLSVPSVPKCSAKCPTKNPVKSKD